nr:Chain B, RNA-binding protein Rsf1-like [Spodoptera aff. frugiperda 1 BOLD-2017]
KKEDLEREFDKYG